MAPRLGVAAMLALAVAACAPLTAREPLFSPADQVGPAPLREGLWIQVGENCLRHNARRSWGRLPIRCVPAMLTRLPDGAWLYRIEDYVPLEAEDGGEALPRAWRLIIAPATERRPEDGYAPIYLVEYRPLEAAPETQGVRYGVFAPVGTLPAREIVMRQEISCHTILRDGPIAGIAVRRDKDGDIEECIASEQSAVREAARRELLENLTSLIERDLDEGLYFVRPAR